jgi:outer membrane protein TolC
MLPQISLTAQRGGTATQLGQLFATGNTFWGGTASFSQTLFAGGALRHEARAARAAMDQAGAQYRVVVLQAFQDVADSLTALELDAGATDAAQRAEHAAATSLTAARSNVENGTTPYLALLNAQQTYENALVNLLQARANRYSDTVALFAALGGGWRAQD